MMTDMPATADVMDRVRGLTDEQRGELLGRFIVKYPDLANQQMDEMDLIWTGPFPTVEIQLENVPRETIELLMGWIQQEQIHEIRPHRTHTDVYWFTGEPPFRTRHWACSSSPNLPPPGVSDL